MGVEYRGIVYHGVRRKCAVVAERVGGLRRGAALVQQLGARSTPPQLTPVTTPALHGGSYCTLFGDTTSVLLITRGSSKRDRKAR